MKDSISERLSELKSRIFRLETAMKHMHPADSSTEVQSKPMGQGMEEQGMGMKGMGQQQGVGMKGVEEQGKGMKGMDQGMEEQGMGIKRMVIFTNYVNHVARTAVDFPEVVPGNGQS